MTSHLLLNSCKKLKAFITHRFSNLWETKEVKKWIKSGRPAPPPHIIKQRCLLEFASRYNLDVLVETGTYLGDMVEAMKYRFKKVYSIELSKDLYEQARQRLSGEANIILLHGDSGIELEKVIPLLDGPALFWLDGHFSRGITAQGSKDTPVFEELNFILGDEQNKHVIIIDDARSFGVDPEYPSIEEVSSFIRSLSPNAKISVENDSLRIVPS